MWNFNIYVHVHQQPCLYLHAYSILPAAVLLSITGPLSVIVTRPFRLDSSETTTQHLILLSTAVRSLTSILLVTERPLPECAKLGERNLTIAPRYSKRPNTQHNIDYHTQHYLSPTHRSRSIVIDRTTTFIDPSTAVGSSSDRAVNSVPPTLVAERASAPLLLRTWLQSFTVRVLNGLW